MPCAALLLLPALGSFVAAILRRDLTGFKVFIPPTSVFQISKYWNYRYVSPYLVDQYIFKKMYTHIRTYTHTLKYIYTHTLKYINTHIYIHAHIYTHIFIYICICTYIYTYTQTHTHVCIYTHTHFFTNRGNSIAGRLILELKCFTLFVFGFVFVFPGCNKNLIKS